MMSYEERIVEDARLIILRELAMQIDARSNEVILTRILDTFGVRRTREWVRTQMRKLAELEAIRIDEAGTVLIATLRKTGRDHVERRSVIEGVSRPSDED